jgi:transketolase
MPSTTLFDRQDQSYRDSVLLPGVKRVAVEAGISDFWRKYVGLRAAWSGSTGLASRHRQPMYSSTSALQWRTSSLS